MRINAEDFHFANIFELLLDSFPDMIHSVDDDGNIVYANRAAQDLLGYSEDDLLGMNIRQVYADEVWADVEEGFKDLKQSGNKNVESLLQTRDKKIIPVEIRSFGIYDDHGTFIRTFSITRDIRERRKLQESLIHQSRLAAIGELASGVAHDINNPLTVIAVANGLSQHVINSDTSLSEESRGKLRQNALNITRAHSSIEKLSNHLRTFSYGFAEDRVRVDLARSLEDALFMSDSRITKAGVQVHKEYSSGRHFVKACENQIEQVFMNLITNACDAMQDSADKLLRLTISTENRDGEMLVKCDVSDTGCGIPEEHSDEIFKSFFTTKPKGQGTGLGLSISAGIVRDQGGSIHLVSQPDRGATFSVWLPRA